MGLVVMSGIKTPFFQKETGKLERAILSQMATAGKDPDDSRF
jgi:hypothetical protein